MKTIHSWLAAAILLLAGASTIRAEDSISVDFFYDHLEPYGYWREVGEYGYCWQPADVDADWRPYSDGRWVYTDAGWTWESHEPFGWAVYHYGRWANLDEIGWVWVPGTEWGPAWVSWRHSPQYVGWAPLPPEAVFRIEIGFSAWVDDYYDIGPSSYCFVENRNFGSRRLRDVFVDRRQNLTIIHQTTNITHITYQNDGVHNDGLRFDQQSRHSEHPIDRYRLDRRDHFDGDPRHRPIGEFQSRVDGDALRVTALPFAGKAASIIPGKLKSRIERPEIDRGWKGAVGPEEIAAMRSQLRSKTAIPQALPPRPRFEKEGERPERPVSDEPNRRGNVNREDRPPAMPSNRPPKADQPPAPGTKARDPAIGGRTPIPGPPPRTDTGPHSKAENERSSPRPKSTGKPEHEVNRKGEPQRPEPGRAEPKHSEAPREKPKAENRHPDKPENRAPQGNKPSEKETNEKRENQKGNGKSQRK